MRKRGKLFVITGPSGVGKTEIAKNILRESTLNIQRVVTCTTRPKRQGEIEGKDYFFLTKKEFLKNIQENNMFEYAQVYENYYGSRKKDVEAILESGKNILFTVDVKGALSLKKISPSSNTFFIKAESTQELKNRLLGRNTDSEQVIHKRLNVALNELKMSNQFDYIITNRNGKIKKAIEEISIIMKEKISKRIILIEGLAGTGKSSVMEELCKKHFIIYEFHTKRKKITKHFGAYNAGQKVSIGNKEVKILEDQLEEIILNSRFMSEDKENIKLKLLTEKMKECLNAKTSLVFKEGFLGCLIDENSKDFLDNIKELLNPIDSIIFLKLSEKQLRERQMKRLGERKGEYDDTTDDKRHKLFMKQFEYLTKDINVIYINASPSPREIEQDIEKKLSL